MASDKLSQDRSAASDLPCPECRGADGHMLDCETGRKAIQARCYPQKAATANPDGESGKANSTEGLGAPSGSNAPANAAMADDVVLSATPNERELFEALLGEMHRQDWKHGPFQGTRLGRSRLALACLDDELRESLQAWRDERKADEWNEARVEVLQVAAVAMRALRDAFTNGDSAEGGASNHV